MKVLEVHIFDKATSSRNEKKITFTSFFHFPSKNVQCGLEKIIIDNVHDCEPDVHLIAFNKKNLEGKAEKYLAVIIAMCQKRISSFT